MAKDIKKSQKTQSTSHCKLVPMNPRVAGIDVEASSVFICIGFTDGHQEIREYLTFTEDLKNMLTWIQQNNIQSVAMESTGVYWIPIYDILGYVRQRSRLFELASQQVQLMHKALVQMNLQLNHVVSDINGATGMNIIRSIVSGERWPAVLAKYRDYRCKKDEKEIAKALDGNYRQEHLLALKHALAAYDFFHQQALECEEP